LIKNSQPFGKKFQKTAGGDFFDSHCTCVFHMVVCAFNMIIMQDSVFSRLYLIWSH